MPKYYVAGIPFDSENALMHYGVKGMKWDQHIFGPDANTKYINWMDVGKMASSKGPSQFTDTKSGGKNPIVSTRNGSQQKGPGLVRSALDKGAQLRYQANQAANQAGKAIGSAAGQALKASSNFLTGNQAQKDLSNAQRSYNFNKKQLVNNARLYNQGISDIRNGMDQTADANRRWYANHDPELYDAIDRDWDKGRQLQQTGREKAETSRNRANDVMKSFLNAKSNRDNAQKSLDSTLPSIANRASEGAKGFINSAGKWISNAAGDVGKSASDAAGWLGDRAGDVGKASTNAWNGVTGAANQAGNWIGDRASDVGDWLGGRADYVGKAATNAWEGAKGAANDVRDFFVGNPDQQNASRMMRNPERSNQGGVLGAAGQWIGDRAGDVAGAATNAWNGVTGAVGDAGQWIGDRAGDVAGAATDAWNSVSGAAGDAGRWIGDRAGDVGEFFTGKNAAQALSDAHRRSVESGNKGFGADVDTARENWRRTLPGMVDYVTDNVRENIIPGIGEAATKAWNGVRGAANSVGDEANEGQKRDRENYTNDLNSAQDILRTAKTASEREDALRNMISTMDNYGGFENEHPFYDDTQLGDYALRAKNNLDKIDHLQSNLDKGWYDGESADRARKELAEAKIDNELLVGEFYNNPNASGKWGPDGLVGKYENTPDNVSQQDWDRYVYENYGHYPNRGRREANSIGKVTPTLNDDQQKQIDYWTGVIDNNIKNFDDYYHDVLLNPIYANATRQDVMRNLLDQKDYWQNRAYREDVRHSAIDDKPDGVTDTFWKNYVASGGTREQYERDWR